MLPLVSSSAITARHATSEPSRPRLPVGADIVAGGVHFRVWAPRATRVDVVIESQASTDTRRLDAEPDGYFSTLVADLSDGALYRYRLDEQERLLPDPASRFQPQGPHGPSRVVDPDRFDWTDRGWRGVTREGQVLYEMHVGTFTREGTWAAAMRESPALARLGVTVLEVMPVADFAGRFGWGYDGVDLYAPTRLYGQPDDFRRFVDRAHALGLGVILDVVYNHLGPDGNYLKQFSRDFFTDRYTTDWGEAINFDGPGAGPVRDFFAANAGYWIDEFHLDGLRLDATQNIYDESPDHILAVLARTVRQAARGRATLLVNENEPQDTRPGRHRASTAVLLLGPGTPMLFQGQEFSASTPFLYFADHKPELAEQVARGRAEFLAQFPSLASPEMQERLASPEKWETFARCKL